MELAAGLTVDAELLCAESWIPDAHRRQGRGYSTMLKAAD
jgi:hypothetical protein